MASLDPMACSQNIYNEEHRPTSERMNPKLVIEELVKALGEPESYQYSPVEQVFMGVLPTYNPPSSAHISPVDDEAIQVYHTCKDCGDKFIVESSLKLHKARTTVSIEYTCVECSQRLTFYNRCNFLSHLRQHNFDPSKKDFSAVDFSLSLLPADKVAGPSDRVRFAAVRGRLEDEQGSNCSSSSTSGFASESRSSDAAPPPKSKPKRECPECREVLLLSLSEHYWGEDLPSGSRYECRHCGLVLPTGCVLAAHERVHCLQRPYVCPECCAEYRAWLPFWTHISRACLHLNRVVRHACQICRCLFDETSALHKHVSLRHTGRDVYVCPYCNSDFFYSEFPDIERLKQHVQQSHSIQKSKKIILHYEPSKCCQLCGDTVLKRKYVGHVFRHCNASRCYAYECKTCKEAFKSKDDYVRHRDTGCLSCKEVKSEPTESTVQAGPHQHRPTSQPKILGSRGGVNIATSSKRSRGTNVNSVKNVDSAQRATSSADPVKKSTGLIGKWPKFKPSGKRSDASRKNESMYSSTCTKKTLVSTKNIANLEYSSFHCKQCDVIIEVAKESLQEHLVAKHNNCKNVMFEPARLVTSHKSSTNKDPSTDTESVRRRRKRDVGLTDRQLTARRKAKVMGNDSDDVDYCPPNLKDVGQFKKKYISSRRKQPKTYLGLSNANESLQKRRWKEKSKPRRKASIDEDTKAEDDDSLHVKSKPDQNVDAAPFSCLICPFAGKSAETFKEHVRGHRTPNDFQCMECGMCFVTKPSFNIHLIMTHKIKDVDVYIANNDCCDLNVVQMEIETPASSVPEEEVPTVLGENQCSICRKVCDSALNLSNHFRTHGMAYLLWKKKQGHTVDTDS